VSWVLFPFELTVLTQEPERHRIWLPTVPVSQSPMRTADIARLCLQPKVRVSTFRCVLPFEDVLRHGRRDEAVCNSTTSVRDGLSTRAAS
jgi:hypothetical protein